jgi:carboxypeptidase Taq
MTAYDDLMAFQRQTEALAQVAGRLGWDQETVMPEGSAAQRAEEIGALEGVLHARRTDPRIGGLAGGGEGPGCGGSRRSCDRSGGVYERTLKVPARLAEEIARLMSLAQGVWASARAKEDVAGFLPTLEKVVALKREEGAALAPGVTPMTRWSTTTSRG